MVHDVCVIVVSHNSRHRLEAALISVVDHAEGLDTDIVVVDNGSDGSADYVESRFPHVRAIRCPNHGFGHANNRALETTSCRYVLFLNPDAELLDGSLSVAISALDHRPDVGLAGVRQIRGDGSLAPTIRRFPSFRHMLAEALGVERIPGFRRVLGERELDERRYDRETHCDWTSSSFKLVRHAALESTGWFDERFFLFSEETDLCWRLARMGWKTIHLPHITVRHSETHGANERLEAQAAYARMQFARKHFPSAPSYRLALALRYAIRAGAYSILRRRGGGQGQAARAALTTVLSGRSPFEHRSAFR
jgi:GT2 family glycosyltransferase